MIAGVEMLVVAENLLAWCLGFRSAGLHWRRLAALQVAAELLQFLVYHAKPAHQFVPARD